ncbi:hypothetical protein B7463_g12040, partial [Scytalidium lignicola]
MIGLEDSSEESSEESSVSKSSSEETDSKDKAINPAQVRLPVGSVVGGLAGKPPPRPSALLLGLDSAAVTGGARRLLRGEVRVAKPDFFYGDKNKLKVYLM